MDLTPPLSPDQLLAALRDSEQPGQRARAFLEEGQARLDQAFDQVPIAELVHGRARLVDRVLVAAWSLFELDGFQDVALVAVGGYGRGELHPHSDVDLMVLFRATPARDACSALEGFVAFLWDIGLEIGHSVRTLDECEALAGQDITVATNIMEARTLAGDDRVRQALAYAFDRESYAKSVWFGFARPTINPVPQEMATYLPESADMYPFDLDKAAALLAEAGFTKDKPLTMEILTIQGFDTLKSMALILQDNLNRLGHKVSVRELEATVWLDRVLHKPDYDITSDNFNTGPEDPASMFNSPNLAPGANVNQWNPEGYADLVAKAGSELDSTKQIALYQELQKLVLEEMPQITVNHLPLFFLGAEGTDTLVIGPSGIDDYTKIAL